MFFDKNDSMEISFVLPQNLYVWIPRIWLPSNSLSPTEKIQKEQENYKPKIWIVTVSVYSRIPLAAFTSISPAHGSIVNSLFSYCCWPELFIILNRLATVLFGYLLGEGIIYNIVMEKKCVRCCLTLPIMLYDAHLSVMFWNCTIFNSNNNNKIKQTKYFC